MSAPTTARVMLVEDHIAFRQALASLLSREPDLEVVAQAGSLAEARELLHTPLDVAVVDLGLPDGDGSDLIGALHRANVGISVLVLSVSIRAGRLEDVLKAGADAVLHKTAPRDHRRGGKTLGWPMSHPQEHDDERWWWLPRTAYYNRTSENSPSTH